MIITNDTVNTLNLRQQQLDAIEKIENIADDSIRWRAIQLFMFNMNPDLRELDLIHQEEVKHRRKLQRSKTGSTAKGTQRALYSMPEYLYRALQMLDPSFEEAQNDKDKTAVKKFNYKIWKAFPEYRIASVI